MLLTAGLHVPGIPLVDVVGRTGAADPLQMAGTAVKVGVTNGFTVTVNVAIVAHKPAVGVKVYVPVAVLLTAGDHVPVTPFVEVVGSTGAADPLQIDGTAVKVGVINGLTVTVSVVVVAHNPAVGVNV